MDIGMISQLGGQAIGAIGSWFGIGDRQQLKQQQKLTDMQSRANSQLMNESYNLQNRMAEKTWNMTNMKAQAKLAKDIGFNPQVVAGGNGNIATGGGGASVGGGQASAAAERDRVMNERVAMSIEGMLAKSQADKNTAEAELARSTAKKQAGVDTELGQKTIAKLVAETNNQEIQGDLMQMEKSIKKGNINLLGEQLKELKRNNDIGDEVKNDMITTIRQQAIGSMLENSLRRSGIEVNVQEANAISEGIQQEWEKIKIQWKNANTNERNAMTAAAAQSMAEDRPTIGQIGGNILKTGLNTYFEALDKLDEEAGTDIPGISKPTFK